MLANMHRCVCLRELIIPLIRDWVGWGVLGSCDHLEGPNSATTQLCHQNNCSCWFPSSRKTVRVPETGGWSNADWQGTLA